MNNLKKYIHTLTGFSEYSWTVLLDCMTERGISKNEVLLKEGTVCQSIFFISSGLCKSVHNVDGKEINTDFFFENDFATNIKSLMTAEQSAYSIIACEKGTVVQFDKIKLLEAYRQSPEIETFGRKVLEMIIARQEEHADSFKLLTPKQRFDRLVATRPDFLQRVSLTQTASYLGISRETLSRLRAIR